MMEKPKQQLRKAFLETITTLAKSDPSVIFVVGDVGFSFIENFRKELPNQFLNAGISEANMLTMAAGMASQGLKPYLYTMSNFILLRPHEQLRNDIAYSNLNVKLFGVKGGPSYRFLGYSHNLIEGEEKGLLKFMPNIKSYFPETEEETSRLMEEEYKREGPAYFSI